MKTISARYALAWVGFLGTCTVYFCRLNLSITIVSMVKDRLTKDQFNASICPRPDVENIRNSTTDHVDDQNNFDWSLSMQGDLLASYYYGYIWSQAAGPVLAKSLGYKKVFGFSMLLASCLTMLSPTLAYAGYNWLFACRIFIGFCHGVTFPCMHGLIGFWAPKEERSKLISIYVSGASIGTMILFPLAGLLIDALGWESVFYFTGITSFIWCGLWSILAYDTPESHSWISEDEKAYIAAHQEKDLNEERVKSVPWKAILTSKPVMAVSAGHLASNWGNYQLNSLLPTYLATVLQFDIKSNGFISSLPFLAQSMVCFLGGYFTDVIRKRDCCSTITIRKINTALGLLVPAITVVLAGYMGCRSTLAVMFFILSVGFNTFTVPGCKTSPLDFAPNQAGAIFAVTNTIANLSGFLAPQTTGRILEINSNFDLLGRWQLAFWLSALVYLPGFLLFQAWGTDQPQPWN